MIYHHVFLLLYHTMSEKSILFMIILVFWQFLWCKIERLTPVVLLFRCYTFKGKIRNFPNVLFFNIPFVPVDHGESLENMTAH